MVHSRFEEGFVNWYHGQIFLFIGGLYILLDKRVCLYLYHFTIYLLFLNSTHLFISDAIQQNEKYSVMLEQLDGLAGEIITEARVLQQVTAPIIPPFPSI